MMKRFVFILFSMLMTLPVMAGYNNMDELFREYAGREGYKTVTLGRKMLSMMQKSGKSSSDVLDKVEQIRILSTEVTDTALVGSVTRLAEDEYELISETSEDKERTSFYIREEKSDKKLFLMIAHRENREIILDIRGDFNITEISKLSDFGK